MMQPEKPITAIKVDIIEYERGYGQRDDGSMICASITKAQEFIKRYNNSGDQRRETAECYTRARDTIQAFPITKQQMSFLQKNGNTYWNILKNVKEDPQEDSNKTKQIILDSIGRDAWHRMTAETQNILIKDYEYLLGRIELLQEKPAVLRKNTVSLVRHSKNKNNPKIYREALEYSYASRRNFKNAKGNLDFKHLLKDWNSIPHIDTYHVPIHKEYRFIPNWQSPDFEANGIKYRTIRLIRINEKNATAVYWCKDHNTISTAVFDCRQIEVESGNRFVVPEKVY